MNIDVIATAQACTAEAVTGKSALVIDVLRFTSVLTTALENGAAGVMPFLRVEDAEKYRAADKEAILLGGERACNRIPGFDFGNSPFEYTSERVKEKKIGITTTNGTVAVNNAVDASALYGLSFLNVGAVVERLIREARDVVFVCAGTMGRFALEDGMCAGAAIAQLASKGTAALSDGAYLLGSFYLENKERMTDVLAHSVHARRLLSLGYEQDITYCYTSDLCDVVPMLKDGMFVRA